MKISNRNSTFTLSISSTQSISKSQVFVISRKGIFLIRYYGLNKALYALYFTIILHVAQL